MYSKETGFWDDPVCPQSHLDGSVSIYDIEQPGSSELSAYPILSYPSAL